METIMTQQLPESRSCGYSPVAPTQTKEASQLSQQYSLTETHFNTELQRLKVNLWVVWKDPDVGSYDEKWQVGATGQSIEAPGIGGARL